MASQQQLLSANQLQRLRDVALLGMITPITIERRSEGPIPADGDYGDDFLTYTVTTESRRQTVKGWFFSSPTPVPDVNTGMAVTVNTYRLYLPVGTDIKVGDHVHVGNADPRDDYMVSDTTAESTWLPLLTCTLRKRE